MQPEETPTLKPAREWLKELEPGYRERALHNVSVFPVDPDKNVSSLVEGIGHSFHWNLSPEGLTFWDEVHNYYQGDFETLPPLPDTDVQPVSEKDPLWRTKNDDFIHHLRYAQRALKDEIEEVLKAPSRPFFYVDEVEHHLVRAANCIAEELKDVHGKAGPEFAGAFAQRMLYEANSVYAQMFSAVEDCKSAVHTHCWQTTFVMMAARLQSGLNRVWTSINTTLPGLA